jgi:diacylglycerol kinase (ATP)
MSIEQQLKKYPEYTARSIDMGILSIDDEQEYYFLNGVGLGFDGVVLQSMQAVRRVGGHIGYLIQVIKNIFSYMEPVFQMHYDENSIYQPITLINFANCKRTGGGFLISPHADPYDGKLHIMYAYVPSKLKRLFLLHKVEKGTHILDKLVTYESATHILVKVKNKIYGQLDGELISGRKFEMKIAPQRLYVKCGGIEK